MKIQNYIKELLTKNQGVIIPRLGGFLSEYESAVFDKEKNQFLPPCLKISFNPKYTYQDNSLIDFISKKEQISKSEATKKLNDFSSEIKTTLNSGNKFYFPEIGELYKNTRSEIVFQQQKDSNLLTNSFGLHNVKTNPIINLNHRENITQQTPQPKKKIKKIIIISLLIILLGAITSFLFFPQKLIKSKVFHTSKKLNNHTASKHRIKIDNIANNDSIKALINQSIDNNTNKKDALFYTPPSNNSNNFDLTTTSKFHIIVGSFKRIENANKFAQEIELKGYRTKVIQSGKNLFRISIFSFNDETIALKKLYSLRDSSNLKSVWVLKEI
ncbi:MAG: SPOR domain-containing protein [Bacteroidales bacterium]|nr:SPOR domain-containing protein [Bacteroidales bacterium]